MTQEPPLRRHPKTGETIRIKVTLDRELYGKVQDIARRLNVSVSYYLAVTIRADVERIELFREEFHHGQEEHPPEETD